MEDGLTTDEEMGLGSKGVEDIGEFDGDVAGTDDDPVSFGVRVRINHRR